MESRHGRRARPPLASVSVRRQSLCHSVCEWKSGLVFCSGWWVPPEYKWVSPPWIIREIKNKGEMQQKLGEFLLGLRVSTRCQALSQA